MSVDTAMNTYRFNLAMNDADETYVTGNQQVWRMSYSAGSGSSYLTWFGSVPNAVPGSDFAFGNIEGIAMLNDTEFAILHDNDGTIDADTVRLFERDTWGEHEEQGSPAYYEDADGFKRELTGLAAAELEGGVCDHYVLLTSWDSGHPIHPDCNTLTAFYLKDCD